MGFWDGVGVWGFCMFLIGWIGWIGDSGVWEFKAGVGG